MTMTLDAYACRGYFACSNTPFKQSPAVKVRFARLKFPRFISTTTERHPGEVGIQTIVDGKAFSSTYNAYFTSFENDKKVSFNHALNSDLYKIQYEYPLRAEIFKHARNDARIKYVATQPVYYVATLKLIEHEHQHAHAQGYESFLATYYRDSSREWRDELAIEPVIFGPQLSAELSSLDQ